MAERKKAARKKGTPLESQRARSQSEEVGKWKGRVQHGRRLRWRWRQKYRVRQLVEAYYGKDTYFEPYEEDEFDVNRFWPTIKALLPTIFFRSPKYRIVPIDRDGSPLQAARAAMDEAILETIAKQENQLEMAIRLALPQALFSVAVLKVSYTPKMIPNPRRGQDRILVDEADEPILDEVTGMPAAMRDPDTGEILKEPAQILSDEVYGYHWVNANNIILPDAGPDQRTWPWVAEDVTVPLEDAKEDMRFPSAMRAQFVANSKNRQYADEEDSDLNTRDGLPGIEDSAMEMFTYTEIYDHRKRRLYIYADGQPWSTDQFLVDKPLPDGIEDNPYAILPGFTPILEPRPLPWPIPHTFNWKPLQDEWTIRRRQIAEGNKRTARKMFYDQTMFESEENAVQALQSSKDMEAVAVRDIQRIPIIQVDAPLPNTLAQDLAFLDRDWIRTTGQPGARIGDTRTDSATEANIENVAAESRDSDMRHMVNLWIAEAGKKMRKLVRATLTNGMYIRMRGFNDSEFRLYVSRVYGDEFLSQLDTLPGIKEIFQTRFGEERMTFVTGSDMEFDADVDIIPGSGRIRTLQQERNQILSFMGIIGQNPQLALSRELMRTIAGTFEFVTDAMIDELFALAQRMVEINARQAGRMQGGDNVQNQPGGRAVLASALNGGR